MATLRFQDKVAIVTGGCQGIGRGCTDVLVENGGKVAVFDIADDIGSTMVADGPGEIFYVHCDVRQEEEVKKSIEAVVKRFGKLDCLVNNVGAHPGFNTIDDLVVDDMRKTIELNLISCMTMSKYALPHLRKTKGNIISMASMSGSMAFKESTSYCATKGAIMAFSKALAIDEGKHGVRVNTISPGCIETPLFKKVVSVDQQNKVKKCAVIGRNGQPREIGLACLYLATDATYTTGADLSCSGGAEIGYGEKLE